MQKEYTDRIEWIDIFKGLVIILMVIGHSTTPWAGWIYLFHMPAFIFIAGYTTNYEKDNFIQYVKRKFLSLIIPFICINMIYIFLMQLLEWVNVYNYFYEGEFILSNSINILFTRLGTIDLGGATWFIVVLFLVEVIFKGIYQICKSNKCKEVLICFLTVVLCSIGLVMQKKQMYQYWYIDLGLYGLIYFYLGYLFCRYKILESKIDHKIMIPLSLVLMFFFSKYYGVKMNWPTRSFEACYINVVAALSGIYMSYIFSMLLSKATAFKSIFINIGRRTYTILILHFLVFRISFIVLYKLNIVELSQLKQLTPIAGNNFWFILSIVTVLICTLIGNLSKRNKVFDFIFNATISIGQRKNISVKSEVS